jgi:HlyD family secretion protein
VKALAVTLALLPLNAFRDGGQVSTSPATQPSIQTAPPSAPSASRGPTMSVHRGSISSAVEAQGYFEPIDSFEVRLRPKVYAGDLLIKSIAANGAAVKKDDVILEIDPEAIDKQLAAVENEDTGSHATLVRTQADAKIGQEQDDLAMRMQTDATRRAQEEMKWWHDVDGPNLLLEAEVGLKNAKANVDDQQDELNELKKMYKSDDLSTDTADIVVKRAVRNLDNTKLNYKVTEDQTNKIKTFVYPARKQQVIDMATQSQEQLASLTAAQAQTKVLRETGLDAAVAATEAVDKRLADLKADKEKMTVRAPADGIVAFGQFVNGGFQGGDERSLRPGEHLAAQQVVLTFYTPGKLRLHLDLNEQKFFSIHAGDKATITPVALADLKMSGKCDAAPAVAINSQQGPQYPLTVSSGDVDSRLVPGMRANFRTDGTESEAAVVVPNTALAGGSVWVKNEDGSAEKRTVVAGKSDGKHTEIKQGLNEGDEIFVEAQK